MKRIAILTDIHGNEFVLDRVLEQLKQEKIDEYIICGDMITDGFSSNDVLEKLRKLTNHIVMGNREEKICSYDGLSWDKVGRTASYLFTFEHLSKNNFLYLQTLPLYKVIEIEGKKICISHGSPFYIKDRVDEGRTALFDQLLKYIPADIYFFGHTHNAFCFFYKGSVFINSGAVSLARNKKCIATYGIMSINENNISYEEKECSYSFEQLKKYYLESTYHDVCNEWCNLLLYTMKTGVSHCEKFIAFFENSDLEWRNAFLTYMDNEKLDVL